MNRFLRPCLALLFVLGVMAAAVQATYAQIERQISYQGLLTLPTGLPLDDGRYDLVLRMYDAPTGGNLLWEETQGTTISKGLFNLYLGAVVPLTGVDFFNTQVYLETALAGQPPFPRTRLAVVPYAIRAERAGLADSISISANGFVRSLNGAEGRLVINGRNGVAVTRTGDTIHIESTITLQGIQNLTSPENTIQIVNPNGPNTTVDVRDGSITAAKIADSVITTAKLVDSLITTVKIADGAVTLTKIAPGVIPTSLPPRGPAGGDLAGTYPNPTIALGAVTGPKLADGSVSNLKITDGAVTTQKIADNSIVTSKVADGAITAAKLSNSGVTAGTYGDVVNIPRITVDDKGRVTLLSVVPLTNFPFIVPAGGDLTGLYPNPQIRTNAVTTDKILDFNVTTPKIADFAVTTPKIAIGAVRSEQVADGSIAAFDLAPGTIPTTLPPTGPATGDLAGTYPAPILATTAGAGSRMVTALRTNFLAGDPNVNTPNNIVMLNASGQFPAANGSLINNLNVNNVGSGTLAVQFGGTNSSAPLNNNRVMVSNAGRIVEAAQQSAGQFLIGTGATTAPAVGQIVAGTGMTVTYSSPNIVIASTTQPGTLNDQTLRWDVVSNAWVPTSNILSSAAGNLTVNGNATLGDAAADIVRMNASAVGIPNVPTSASSSNVVVRNPVSGNLEVSTAIYSTSSLPLAANTAVRTNATGQLESVALTNGQILVGSTGAAPVAATITGTANRVIVTNGAGSITLSTPQDIATTSNVNFNSVTTANNAVIGTSLNVVGAATVGGTLGVTGATTLSSSLTQSGGQVTFNGNVDANSGLDVIGATSMNGTLTQSGGQVTFSGNVDALGGLDVAGLTTMSGAVTQTGTGQVTFGGNVDANNGLDVTGATTLTGNVTQSVGTVTVGGATTFNNTLTQNSGQVTFNGNVDANAGLDVFGANLTVGGANFTVNPANGNVATNGSLSVNGAATLNSTLTVAGSTALNGNVVAGDGTGDNVTLNTTGGTLRMTGLPNVAGTDVLMIGAGNDVSRFAITGLIGADEGLTYNEAGSAKVRLGSVNTLASTMTGNRFVNMGNNDLRFTTNGGNSTVLWLDGDATNFGVDLFAGGTGAIDLTGTTRIVGATSVTGAMTQSGGQVTLGGNVDANSGLDVLGGNLTVGGTNFTVSPTNGNTATSGTLSALGAVSFSSTLNVAGTSTMNGNVVAGDGTGDNVTINTAGGGALTMVGLPVTQGVDVLMANGANIITRSPLAAILAADNGITYNEGGLGFMRLGSTTNLGVPLNANRFVNLGNNDLRFTTNGGAVNLLTLDGDATNYGVSANAAGTGTIALNGATNVTGATTLNGSVTQNSGQVTLNGNVDANNGIDVVGATTLAGNVTQTVGTVTVNGATTVNNTFTQNGATNQVTFNGNVDAKNGLDVIGLTSFTGAVIQGGGQATFSGNLDATAGLDVTGQDLTVGGSNFTVNPATGNTSVNGTFNVNGATSLNGNVTMGNGTSDNVVIDVSGGAGTLRMNGLVAGAGTDLLMINATNIVSRTPLANLIDADQGVTYNEAGSGRMRLGSTTNLGVPFVASRFINMGNNDLTITTNNGAQNLVIFDGDATNAGVTVAPTGTGRFTVNGGSTLNGAVTMTNTVTQTGTNQVTFGGNVDANNGLDVAGANLTVGGTLFTVAPATGNTSVGGTLGVTGAATLNNTLTVAGNTALNGNVNLGNGTGDDITIDVSGAGGDLTINGLPVVAGTEVLMSNALNVITKTPLVALIDANQGITYNEDGTGKIRLGGTTNLVNPFAVNRFVNLGNFDLTFTTNFGANNILVLDGGALNYGAVLNAGGTGTIALNGPTNVTGATSITGNTTITGQLTQNGSGQVTFNGNVDANSGVDVAGTLLVNGPTNLTGNLVQSAGTVNLGGSTTTIGGATTINNTMNVNGAATLGSSLQVNGATTLGDAAADNVTINAATVTIPNLPTATVVNKFIMSGTGGALQIREINNIVTGTGTPNRLTRWDVTGAGILDASLSDDGLGNLTRTGNVNINPGAAFALATNGNFNVTGGTTLTGTATMNGAVNLGNGGDLVAVNVTGSQLTLTGLATAVGTDVLMANGANVVSRTPITSLINADQGLTYNEGGTAAVRLGSTTRNTSPINASRFVEVGAGGRLTFTTNGGNAADDMFTLTGGTANYGMAMRSKGTGKIDLKAGVLNGVGDVTSGSYLSLAPSGISGFKYVNTTPGSRQEMGVVLDPSAPATVIITAENIEGGSSGELRVSGSGIGFSGPMSQATPDLVQFSGNVEMARKLDVVGNFAVFLDRFTVDASTGNTGIRGTLNANGSVNLGDGVGNDGVTANVTGSTLRLIGLGTVPGTDVLMVNAGNVVSRTPITNLIGADQGLTYNEDGAGRVRLGATTNAISPLIGNRFVNLGNFDLTFTTNNGARNVMVLDGDAANSGVALTAAGTGSIAITGTTTVTGPSTFSGALTQGGGTATINGAATFTSTITQTGSGAVTLAGPVTASNSVTMNGAVTIGDAAADALTINAGNITANNIPVGTTSTFVTLSGTTVQQRTINNIVTGTGTPNRMTRWLTSSTIGDASLDDAGAGVLSRAGDIAINPGAANQLSTNGRFSVTGATTLNSTLNVTGATTLSSSLQVTGATNLNGAVTLGNGDADAITVNGTGGLVVNTGAAADLTITEGAITRAGNIALTTGTGNAVNLDGSISVDASATVRGNTTLGDAATDQISIVGVTNINTGGSTASTSIGNATGAFTLTSSGLNVAATGVISDANSDVEINDGLSVSGATSLGSTLTVTGGTNLNGTVTLGNGDADAIAVNSSSGLVINTGAAADLTITETAITRAGNLAINTGAANSVSLDGSLIVDQNVTVRGNTALGNANSDVIQITGTTSIVGGTNINSSGTNATAIGNSSALLNLRGSLVDVVGPFRQSGGDATFEPGPGKSFSVTTDGAAPNSMMLLVSPASASVLISSDGAAAGQANEIEVSATGITLGTTDPPNSRIASVATNLAGNVTITSTGTAAINGTTRITGATSINTTAGDPSTSIGNASSAVTVLGSSVSVNAASNGGNTSIGNNAANNSTVTISAGSSSGNIVFNGVAVDATPTQMLTLNASNQVRRTDLSGTANQGVIFTAGQYRLGGTTATEVPFVVDRFVNLNNNNLSFTANSGAQTPLQVTGGANSGVALRASGGSGVITVAGTTNINTTGGAGATSIGNSTNPLSMAGSVVSILGITNVNTTGTAATSIGNAGGLLTLRGSSVDVTGNVTANNDVTVTGTTNLNSTANLNSTSNLNGNTNLGNGDGDVITVNTAPTANLVIAETGLTRVGNIAVNPGAGNSVTTNGSLSVTENASVTGNTTVTGTTNLNGTSNLNGAVNIGNGDADAIVINTAGNFSLASSNLNISATGVITDNVGAVEVNDDLTVTGITTITGTTNVNASGSAATTIGSAATGGAVSVASSGLNNITLNPGGDLVLQSIDVDIAPTQMMTLTAAGAVRRTDLAGTADQGVIYTNGKYLLGGTTSTQVPLTTDRFINLGTRFLRFTTSSGQLLNLTGTTLTATGNLTQSAGNVSFTPGTGNLFSITGATRIAGLTEINNAAGSGATTIGNSTNLLTLTASTITADGNFLQKNGYATFETGPSAFTVEATGANAGGVGATLLVGNGSGGISITAMDNTGILSEFFVDPTNVTIGSDTEILINTMASNGATRIGNAGKALELTGTTTVVGNTRINNSGSGTTTIGSSATGGAVSVSTSGLNNITLNPGGDLVLQSIDTDPIPTQMLTMLSTGEVRKTTMSSTAEQGVIYDAGKYKLGGATNTEVPFTTDRFVNISNRNLNFTTSSGTLLNLTGASATVTGNFVQSGGNVNFTPGATKSFNVTGSTTIKGADILLETTGGTSKTSLTMSSNAASFAWNQGSTIERTVGFDVDGIFIASSTSGSGTEIALGDAAINVSGNTIFANNVTVNGSTTLGNQPLVDLVNLRGIVDVQGVTSINVTGAGSTTIGNTTTSGAVTVASSGVNNITLNPGGDLVLQSIDADATPTQMLTLNASNQVRRTTLTGTANEGIEYNTGAYRLGDDNDGNNAIVSSRFVRVGTGGTLTFNTGTATQLVLNNNGNVGISTTGATSTMIGNAAGTVGITGTTVGITGATTVTGATNINTTGTASTSIGNTTGDFSLSSSNLRVTSAGVISDAVGNVEIGDNLDVTGTGTNNIGVASATNTILGTTSITGVTTVTGTTNINTTGTASTSIGNTTGDFSLSSSNLRVTNAGVISDAVGNVEIGDNLDVTGTGTNNIGVPSATNTILGTTSITGATTVTGATNINATGSAATTIGSTAGGAVSIASGGVNNITLNPGGDLNLQSIDLDAAPTQMLTMTSGGNVRRTDMAGTADQGVSYTSGKYQLGAASNSGVPLTQNRFVNSSDFTLDFTYNDAGTQRSMFRLNDGEVVVTAPANFRVIGPTSVRGNTNINSNAGDGTTAIGNAGADFSVTSNNINISATGVINDASGDIELNDNVNVANNLTVGGTVKGAGAERLHTAGASNKFAERVRINGNGGFMYSISNNQFQANSVVIITLEDYSGPGILSYQIKRPTLGSIDVYFSQPILTGESVVVNVMVVNQ